jgi:hypothetical protein
LSRAERRKMARDKRKKEKKKSWQNYNMML